MSVSALPQHLGDLGVADSPHVDEMIKAGLKPRAHRALVVGAKRDRGGFEARPVMGLEHTGHQERGGVRAKIRREIGHAYLVVPVDVSAPQRHRRRAIFLRGPDAGKLGLLLG